MYKKIIIGLFAILLVITFMTVGTFASVTTSTDIEVDEMPFYDGERLVLL